MFAIHGKTSVPWHLQSHRTRRTGTNSTVYSQPETAQSRIFLTRVSLMREQDLSHFEQTGAAVGLKR